MDAEILRAVIRNSVVRNQDEQLATVLLMMVEEIEMLQVLRRTDREDFEREIHNVKSMVWALESAPPKEDGATQRSENSSAATGGTALKLLGSFTATPAVLTVSQQEDLQRCLREVILAFSNSLPFTLQHMELHWNPGQTLQVTCWLRTDSGANKAGDPGRAAPTEDWGIKMPGRDWPSTRDEG